jgi:hypothetical protein
MTAKVGIVELGEAVIARQRHGKHFSASTGGDATIEDAVFSMWPFVAKAL